MKTKCTFRCDSVTDMGETKAVSFSAALDPERSALWKATPSGRLELSGLIPKIEFVAGKLYYLDISTAETN